MVNPLSQAALGRALGLSPPAITKLKKQGMPTHSLEAAMAWRVANTRARAEAGRRTPQGPKDQPTSAPGGDYQSARARRERAEAEKAELDLAERKGELKRVEQVRAPIAAALLSLREGLLQLPKRLAPQLVAEQDQSLIERKLDTEIRAQLAKAATLEATDGRA